MIAVRLFSALEFKRFRSICRSWRSSSSDINPFPPKPLLHLNPLIISVTSTYGNIDQIYGLDLTAFLSRAAFFRVTLSSSERRQQGWLIKSDSDLGSEKFHLLNPLSRLPLQFCKQNIDLLEFTVSEIGEAFMIQTSRKKKLAHAFKRVILGDSLIFGVGVDGNIRYGPSLDEDDTTSGCYSEKSFVECCGELYIVDRLLEGKQRKREVDNIDDNGNYVVRFPKLIYAIHDNAGFQKCKLAQGKRPKTVGFNVFKMDEESGKWVEVKSLGDYAIVMATDCCFSVLANEFYGCLQSSIYFSDDEEELNMFKLDDGSITTTTTMTGVSHSCFEMFVPSFC
ncbi:hypothetical protein AALP_AA3G178500 [Arabis alpina]|uniref:KIB1-4 beta-propeller domain-containing protein n=1 Tax=Arabis alpina TaxID=50452 RepID=A0A087H9X6_ARAAL|nr:hypothetical protein AALP_AA3G178500 [Arabis alpina]